ncbi:MAG: alpha/beta fold hydrolase [Acidobacteria bacterium]|nr:alpha/beta fold hydrolase [Acidobacteriota bacterium]
MSSPVSRRQLLQSLAAAPLLAAARRPVASAQPTGSVPYGDGTLPAGIRSRLVSGVNGITMHVLEAGFEPAGRPGVLLVHGFPELAYSWRKVMLPLAAAGYHVMAPDQRGYGRSAGTEVTYDEDLAPFSTLNRVRDMLALVSALSHRTVAAIVGHDFGSPVAAWCALARPDVFRSVVMMSAPFGGREHGGRPRRAHAAPNALPGLLHHARGQREHVASATGPARVPARVLSREERRLAGQHARSAAGEHGRGVREASALLRDGPGEGHGRAGGRGHAVARTDRRVHVAARSRTGGLRGGVRPHGIPGRTAVVPRGPHATPLCRAADLCRPHHRRAGAVHLGQERLGRVPAGGRLRGHADDGVHGFPWRAPARGRRTLGAAGAAGPRR